MKKFIFLKKINKMLFLPVFAFILVLVIHPMETRAAAAPVELTQTGGNSSYVSFEWKKVVDANWYVYQYTVDPGCITNANTVVWSGQEKTASISASVYNLSGGTTYYIRICSLASTDDPNRNWSRIFEVNTAPAYKDGAIATETSCDYNSMTYSWPAIAGATGYDVKVKINNNKQIDYASTNLTQITINGLETNSSVYIYVYPYRTSANSTYKTGQQNFSAACGYTLPTKPEKISVSCRHASGNPVDFEWIKTTNLNNVTGYYIQICNASGKQLKLIDTMSSSQFYNLRTAKYRSTAIQYRMCSYISLAGKKYCSDWTAFKRYIPGAVAKSYKNGVLKWKKVSGATSYTVYMKTTKNPKWKVVAKNVKGTKAKVKGSKYIKYFYIKPNKVKYGKKTYNGASPNAAADIFWEFY